MSVCQVKQYYVYLSNLLLNESQQEEVKQFIGEKGFGDYSINSEHVTVDGFESEQDAEFFEVTLYDLINYVVNK